MTPDHTIFGWCRNEPGYVLRIGHFNNDNNADLLCDDTVNGMIQLTALCSKVEEIHLTPSQKDEKRHLFALC